MHGGWPFAWRGWRVPSLWGFGNDLAGFAPEEGRVPFSSAKQMRFLFARHPEIAKRWLREYGPYRPERKQPKRKVRRRL